MDSTRSRHRLLIEPAGSEDPERGAARREPAFLEIPAGRSFLCWSAAAAPVLRPAAAGAEPTAVAVLEPLAWRGLPVVLCAPLAGPELRLNGEPMPRLAPLGLRDRVDLPALDALHLTAYLEAGAAPASGALVGRECPVCRVPITEGARVLVCGHCSAALHEEGEEKPAEERLECALLGATCPVCGTTLQREGGWAWLPTE